MEFYAEFKSLTKTINLFLEKKSFMETFSGEP